MARISKAYLEKRFARVHAAMGWPAGPVWTREADGNNRSKVGVVFLERGYMRGWKVTEIVNESGGQRDLTGFGQSLSASELDAWFSGILYAKEGER